MELSDITIRTTLKAGDIGYMTYMHGILYSFGLEFELYVARTLCDFYQKMDPSRERVWLAEYQGRIVGSLALKNTEEVAQLRYFLIEPECRGIGLGNRMMDLFMQYFKDCGYTSSFLVTESKLKTAKHLYEKYGYQYVSESTTDFGLIEKRYELNRSLIKF